VQIELIAPASEDSAALPRLAMGILAAKTPPEDEIVYTDEALQPFDLHGDLKEVDLVAISVDSKTARRSYEIADAYRARGTPVVLGGVHATALPDEAGKHADAVVVREAEDLWPEVLREFKQGRLAPRYSGPLPSLGGQPAPRRDLFRSRRYIPFQAVQTMRGCPYPCEFCSVSSANGTRLRRRPIGEVAAELGALGKLVLFSDDNVMIHRRHSRELFEAVGQLDKRWIGQCSLAAVERIENVKLMADSGCQGLFIGFESVDDATLRSVGKRQNHPERYREIVQMLTEHGIGTWGSFVFGFDTDDREVFDRTVEFGIRAQLTMASFGILTPYPGTRLYRRLAAEGRLTDPAWWLRPNHDAGSPYFRPAQMSREQLREGWIRAWHRFYSPGAILDRWAIGTRPSLVQLLGYLPINLLQNRLARRKIEGGTPRFLH
jgi:radical SAM superfamily enzyme YgiQ (UPF0313 family)